jgi:hypothetical protein
MKRMIVLAAMVELSAAPLVAGGSNVSGSYVEARTAEVFNKHVSHDPTCGAQMWFKPLSSVNEATLGVAETHSFSGTGLGVKWSDPNKRSAFFGTFGN